MKTTTYDVPEMALPEFFAALPKQLSCKVIGKEEQSLIFEIDYPEDQETKMQALKDLSETLILTHLGKSVMIEFSRVILNDYIAQQKAISLYEELLSGKINH